MLRSCLWCGVAVLGALSVALAADNRPKPNDWPQWQGKDRTAISRETGLLKEWPKEGPPLAWQVEGMGEGYATPTVAAGRIYSMGNKSGKELVMAYDEADGKELWAREIGPVRSNGGGYAGPRCSPTVDGDLVYALGLNGDLVCVRADSGQIVWRKSLPRDFGGNVGGWGYCESPLIDGDRLVCTPGGKQATLVALNKKTGALIWRGIVPQGDGAHYSSIAAATVNGRRQYVQFLSGGVVGISGEGRLLWRYNKCANGTANCSTPIYADNCVFAASGYGTGGGLVRLVPRGAAMDAQEVYFTKNMKNQHGGIILADGHIYGSDEGQLTCLDFKTGDVKWAERRPGKGSIAAADGRIYYRNESGPIVLCDLSPEGYQERGRFEQPRKSGSNTWPHPVIANGKLYLRDQDLLFCYDIKAR